MSSYSVTSKKSDGTVQMVCKANSIFNEIFKIYTLVYKRLCKGDIKKINALNNLRKKGTSLTLKEDELLAEQVSSYPCLYDKTCKVRKGKYRNVMK